MANRNFTLFGVLIIATLILGSGCAESMDPTPFGNYDLESTQSAEVTETQALFVEGSPQAVGILNLLNDPSTTFDLLDRRRNCDGCEGVGLNRRSARMLIHHRDGADGRPGTWDDNLFDSIAEVDAVRWVGTGALTRILTFASEFGYVPAGAELLGVYDGVPFSVHEADIVIDFVNRADYETLDYVLNRRSVESIIQARPIETIEGLSKLYYVGGTALTRVKDLATGNVF